MMTALWFDTLCLRRYYQFAPGGEILSGGGPAAW